MGSGSKNFRERKSLDSAVSDWQSLFLGEQYPLLYSVVVPNDCNDSSICCDWRKGVSGDWESISAGNYQCLSCYYN